MMGVEGTHTDLNLISKVDDYGVAHWWHIDPLPVLEQLEAADLVVLEEQDDASGIGVSPQAFE